MTSILEEGSKRSLNTKPPALLASRSQAALIRLTVNLLLSCRLLPGQKETALCFRIVDESAPKSVACRTRNDHHTVGIKVMDDQCVYTWQIP